ncbi:MAG: PorP/SprF family type IX secretion system membrane protein [Bacteroidales bacterium]|nr:PorP/SprF family type IX secretion system membrane protein [Bacteroidales bacterium]
MIRYLLAGIALFAFSGAYNQEPFFSQPYNSPVFYNPANLGIYKGLTARVTYRNQWPQYFSDIKTYNLTLDLAERSIPGIGGFGLIVNTNDEGPGFIKRTTIGFAATSRIKLSRFLTSHVGLTGSYVQKSIGDFGDYIFSDQLDDRHGLIYDQSSFNYLPNTKTGYPDLAIGGMVNYMKKNISATTGLAIHHVFKPDESFLGLPTRVPRKWIGHAEMVIGQKRRSKGGFLFNPSIFYEYQGGFSTYNISFNAAKSVLYAGLTYRNKESEVYNFNVLVIMAGVKLPIGDEQSRVLVAYSYDLTLSGMKGTGGAHEIHLNFEFDRIKLFKSKSVFREDYDYPVFNKPIRF